MQLAGPPEPDVIILGWRAAAWWEVAADNPEFMLAGLKLKEAAATKKVS